jgi:hypothetical protein
MKQNDPVGLVSASWCTSPPKSSLTPRRKNSCEEQHILYRSFYEAESMNFRGCMKVLLLDFAHSSPSDPLTQTGMCVLSALLANHNSQLPHSSSSPISSYREIPFPAARVCRMSALVADNPPCCKFPWSASMIGAWRTQSVIRRWRIGRAIPSVIMHQRNYY